MRDSRVVLKVFHEPHRFFEFEQSGVDFQNRISKEDNAKNL
jgi:hypothetical protein